MFLHASLSSDMCRSRRARRSPCVLLTSLQNPARHPWAPAAQPFFERSGLLFCTIVFARFFVQSCLHVSDTFVVAIAAVETSANSESIRQQKPASGGSRLRRWHGLITAASEPYLPRANGQGAAPVWQAR